MIDRLSKYAVVCALLLTSTTSTAEDDFSVWLGALQTEAIQSGISAETVQSAVQQIGFLPEVIALDRSQPEFITPFLEYYQKRVDKQKVQHGRQMLIQHEAMLNQIENRFGVSRFTLMAFWGMETQYGRSLGKLDILSSLATLAYDGRRNAFFRDQLLDAIRMVDIGHVDATAFMGSWAGAFGNMQFMPTTFMLYAVDGDGDNLIDLVDSLPDAFASAANYLTQVGWHINEPTMLEVQLPENFDWESAQLSVRKPIEEWSRLGVRALHVDAGAPGFYAKPTSANATEPQTSQASTKINSHVKTLRAHHISKRQSAVNKLPGTVSLEKLGLTIKGPAAILLPQGYRGPAFMVFENFDVIMDWNRSINYALSVAQLAEQLRHDSRIIGGQSAESGALSFYEMLDLQSMLNTIGFDAGEPDGLPGIKTQEAIRKYQLVNQLPADGYASRSVYQKIYAAQQ